MFKALLERWKNHDVYPIILGWYFKPETYPHHYIIPYKNCKRNEIKFRYFDGYSKSVRTGTSIYEFEELIDYFNKKELFVLTDDRRLHK